MRRVSALILLAAAVGVNSLSFGVNGKALHQPTKVNGPFGANLPFPSPTSLQQQRWDRDYRDNAPTDEPRTRRYGNRNSPSMYNAAPQTTEAGWWNEEKKNFATSENRMDRRVFTSGQYNQNDGGMNGMQNRNYLPVANNVNAQNYDVTPDEWKQNNNQNDRYSENFDRNAANFGNGRPRQILRANDRDQVYQYNGMPPNQNDYNNNNNGNMGMNMGMGMDNQNYPQGQLNNDYNYGFGGQRGQIVGTFDTNNNKYDPNDVTPAEWQDSKTDRRRQGGAMIPGRGNNIMMNNGQNGYSGPSNMNYQGNPMNYNGNFEDNGLYDPTQGQGSWWNQESKDYRTNAGRQETRAFGSGPMTAPNNRNGVRPDEWNDNSGGYGYNQDNGRFGMQPIGYKARVQGPPQQVRSWWDNVKNGFRSGGNSRYGNNNNYGSYGNRSSRRYSNNYNNNNNNNYSNNNSNSNGYVNVGYNQGNNQGNTYNDNYQGNNQQNYNSNNNGYYPRYDNYYDEYSRPEYVTQDSDWWKEETRHSNTW